MKPEFFEITTTRICNGVGNNYFDKKFVVSASCPPVRKVYISTPALFSSNLFCIPVERSVIQRFLSKSYNACLDRARILLCAANRFKICSRRMNSAKICHFSYYFTRKIEKRPPSMMKWKLCLIHNGFVSSKYLWKEKTFFWFTILSRTKIEHKASFLRFCARFLTAYLWINFRSTVEARKIHEKDLFVSQLYWKQSFVNLYWLKKNSRLKALKKDCRHVVNLEIIVTPILKRDLKHFASLDFICYTTFFVSFLYLSRAKKLFAKFYSCLK